MAGHMPENPSQQGIARGVTSMCIPEEPPSCVRKWYFSRQEIEDHSPSRKDGIDLRRESQLRKLYCDFLQDLGITLKVPQVTIASGMMLCHRFYMHQSHAKNDWQTIATVSMFLVCKIEETPRLLKDVVVVAYEMVYKSDPSAPQRIRQREVYDKQKQLILVGERLLLSTIAFDLNIQLPYKPLVTALKTLKLCPDLAKVAWNFVNDWLRTTLCLQYKPHYIAAASMFLAAKFKKVKLPTEKGKVWWLEFDISPKQLEEVIQQVLRFLEQDRKQLLPTVHGRMITQSRVLVAKAVVSSPQSCIKSGSTADCHSSHRTLVEAGVAMTNCSQNLAKGTTRVTEKETLPSQTSDSGSASSVVEDGDGDIEPKTGESGQKNSSYNIVSVHTNHNNIDTNRIRETFKRRKCDKAENKKFVEAIKSEIDSEAWIEKELENGIELQHSYSEKKRRKLL